MPESVGIASASTSMSLASSAVLCPPYSGPAAACDDGKHIFLVGRTSSAHPLGVLEVFSEAVRDAGRVEAHLDVIGGGLGQRATYLRSARGSENVAESKGQAVAGGC